MKNRLPWIRWLLGLVGQRGAVSSCAQKAQASSDPLLDQAIGRWEQELEKHLQQVSPPEGLTQRVLGQMVHRLEVEPSSSSRWGQRGWAWRWSVVGALVVLMFAAAGIWVHLRPSPNQLLAQKLWQVFCQRYEAPDQVWFTHTSPPPEDEVPAVVRACSRLRWKKLKLDHLTAVVHELVNHEQASRRAWLFVVHRAEVALPSRPPRSPQWQAGEVVAGCWADPGRGRTYVLIVPGGVQAYRFWITPRRVA